MCRHWSTRLLSLAEVEAEMLGNTHSNAQALVDTLVDSLAEVQAAAIGDTLSDAQQMVDMLPESLAD